VTQPLVSVIIPLYNAARYIRQSLNAIANQTWDNIEVIIIDDGSTDESYKVAKQYVSERVTLIKQVNAGASAARNRGLERAKGKYIQFCDADDLLSSNKIAAQVTLLEKYPDYLAVCDTAYFDDGTNPYETTPVGDWYATGTDDPIDFLIKLYGGYLIGDGFGGMIQPNAWLTPRTIIDKAGPWNEMRCPDDDGEFFCRVILASKGIRYAPHAVNYYRKFSHRQSLSGQRSPIALRNILNATHLKETHLLSVTKDPRASLAMSRLYWENAFSFYPADKALSMEALRRARALAPGIKFKPFDAGLKSVLAHLIGWKAVRYLQSIR
jgi:glycosyltransferase involved in cell wall biosynthesis